MIPLCHDVSAKIIPSLGVPKRYSYRKTIISQFTNIITSTEMTLETYKEGNSVRHNQDDVM